MRLEPRQRVPGWYSVALPMLALFCAFLLCALLIVWAGESPVNAYWTMIKGALGSRLAVTESLTRAIPLIFTGLAAAVAFRAKFWNIGAEGQLYMGALAATFAGHRFVHLARIGDDSVVVRRGRGGGMFDSAGAGDAQGFI